MPPASRDLVFDRNMLEDLRFWVDTDRRVARRLLDLVEAVRRAPFEGTGKPEPLKHDLGGLWSRRLTDEHRLVYRVAEDRITFLAARHHY